MSSKKEYQKLLNHSLRHIKNIESSIENASNFNTVLRFQRKLELAKSYTSGLQKAEQLLSSADVGTDFAAFTEAHMGFTLTKAQEKLIRQLANGWADGKQVVHVGFQGRAIGKTMLMRSLGEYLKHSLKAEGTTESGSISIGDKEVCILHTAANEDAHLFIDNDHNPSLCPECIRPGTLSFSSQQSEK